MHETPQQRYIYIPTRAAPSIPPLEKETHLTNHLGKGNVRRVYLYIYINIYIYIYTYYHYVDTIYTNIHIYAYIYIYHIVCIDSP